MEFGVRRSSLRQQAQGLAPRRRSPAASSMRVRTGLALGFGGFGFDAQAASADRSRPAGRICRRSRATRARAGRGARQRRAGCGRLRPGRAPTSRSAVRRVRVPAPAAPAPRWLPRGRWRCGIVARPATERDAHAEREGLLRRSRRGAALAGGLPSISSGLARDWAAASAAVRSATAARSFSCQQRGVRFDAVGHCAGVGLGVSAVSAWRLQARPRPARACDSCCRPRPVRPRPVRASTPRAATAPSAWC